MKINVLYLIDSIDYGGAEKQLIELIRNLDPIRCMPHLCCLKQSGPLYDSLEFPKFTLKFKGFANGSIFPAVRALAAYIRNHNIHIVQTFFQDPFLLAALARSFCHVKLIGTFLDLGFWRTPVESFKMRFAYLFFSGFIANSAAVKRHFAITDRIRPEKIQVIYNGFNYSQVATWAQGEKSELDEGLVGIVANLNRPVKRVEDFVRAAAIVYRCFPKTRFVIVGDGHLKRVLQNLSASLGISAVVDFLGRISKPLEYIRRLDVGVICSESEGFSNAIIEYMACGVPVVATNVGGNPELVEENINGFLIPVGHYEIMAEKICLLLHDADLRRRMGEANRKKIKHELSVDMLAAKHEGYYSSLLERQ